MFINPLEILHLQLTEIPVIDPSILKKSKRMLFAEIELSDNGHIDYKGFNISKSDCEKAVETLENPAWVQFYSYLASTPLLNDFLVNGDESFIYSFQEQTSYDPEFKKFISSYFASSFDKLLHESFLKNEADKIKLILKTNVLIEPVDLYIAYQSLSREIKDRADQMDLLAEKITEAEFDFEIPDGMLEYAENLFPKEIFDLLPPDFQRSINQAATSINQLAISIYAFKMEIRQIDSLIYTTDSPFDPISKEEEMVSKKLLEFALKFDLESSTKSLIQENLDVLNNKEVLLKSKICFFCNRNSPDPASSVKKTLYRQTEMQHGQNTLETTHIFVNRCLNCRKIHAKSKKIFYRILLGSIILSLISTIFVLSKPEKQQPSDVFPIMMFAVVIALAGLISANNVSSKYLERKRFVHTMGMIERQPFIISKTREGWTLSKPDKYGKLPESEDS